MLLPPPKGSGQIGLVVPFPTASRQLGMAEKGGSPCVCLGLLSHVELLRVRVFRVGEIFTKK